MQITVNAEVEKTLKGLHEVGRKIIPKSIVSALNKTATQGKTVQIRAIRKKYNVPAKDLDPKDNRRFRIIRASINNLTAVIQLFGRVIGLRHFGMRKRGQGVSVKVRKDRGRKTVKGGFAAPAPGSSTNRIWKRTGEPKRRMETGRYKATSVKPILREPIKPLWGPSPTGMAKDVGVQKETERVVREYFFKNYLRELKRRLYTYTSRASR